MMIINDAEFRKSVVERAQQMDNAPRMYAYTVEAFAMQLSVLGELLGYNHTHFLEPLLEGRIYHELDSKLTEAMAHRLVAHFMDVLAKDPNE